MIRQPSYGPRTGRVRLLSVGTASSGPHTGHMATDTRPTTFVTGAAHFIGSELIKLLVARQHRVFGLAESVEAAERVRRLGAVAVLGDLREPGAWQDDAAADWVFHVVSHSVVGPRMTRRRAASITRARVSMDAHLLDAATAGPTQRIVYVADTSCYGATGARPITEDTPTQPTAWGRCLTPALERLDGYIVAGHPIVTALPGWVYGNGGWFRQCVIEPVMAGRRVLLFGKTGTWVSPIHVEDCARALVHLAEYGEPSGRYFVVNPDPVRLNDFSETFARFARRPLRVVSVPPISTRLVVGPVLAGHLQTDAVFSNIRLRSTRFRFLYPTLEQGIQQIVGVLDE